MNSLHIIRNVIYSLKREYGRDITVYRRTKTITNVKKGTQQTYYRPYYIKRVPVLPAIESREEHTRGSTKRLQFSYFDQTKTIAVVDGRDLTIVIEEDDLVQIDSDQYIVSKVDNAGDGRSFLLQLKAVEAYTRIKNFDLCVFSSIQSQAGVSNV